MFLTFLRSGFPFILKEKGEVLLICYMHESFMVYKVPYEGNNKARS